MDYKKIEDAVRSILEAVGEDPDREGLLETPSRVAKMYGEIFSGLSDDPKKHLKIFFEENCEEVYEKDDCAAFEPFCCSNRVSGAARRHRKA